MTALILGAMAMLTVVLSFAFSLAVLALSRQPQATEHRTPAPTPASDEQIAPEAGSPSETMSRVLRDVERLTSLRERGALTDKEFTAQKAKLLVDGNAPGRAPRPSRTR
jgi:Short C-terminal domain